MRNALAVLVLVLSLPACSGQKENHPVSSQPSALIGSLAGRWSTGCVPQGLNSSKQTLFMTASSGLHLLRIYPNSECKGEPNSTLGPTEWTYVIQNRPEPGKGRLVLSGTGKNQVSFEALLFDDILTLTASDYSSRYLRVTEEKN